LVLGDFFFDSATGAGAGSALRTTYRESAMIVAGCDAATTGAGLLSTGLAAGGGAGVSDNQFSSRLNIFMGILLLVFHYISRFFDCIIKIFELTH
jgi:hypothetical protein